MKEKSRTFPHMTFSLEYLPNRNYFKVENGIYEMFSLFPASLLCMSDQLKILSAAMF